MARQGERTAVLESELKQLRLDLERMWERHRARGVVVDELKASVDMLHEWQRWVHGIAARIGRWAALGMLTIGAELASGVWGQLFRVFSKLLSP